uniref:Probable cytosol aminopeptidase n=1 Tax=Candidatus Kentrum sp. TUN TaxID=2126343 RepID=A0A450ZFY5_9GAMM|nr:MAG: aminopeptidase A. Metallo peptidase. MEROPS family M17 [Candidatus Kentron sp. TUN]VFK52297.1 MAG: aminopeptidase A. Metallo peptidase. MEROPS family M17 [Candidatus Kentron sp. TUN]VFK52722.1 MAG: aminopeptidase A. Metallo peptidase. MEROPS family M17 [Candidatus Kentron sp. TUN]
MDFSVKSIDFKRQPIGCLVLGVMEPCQLTDSAQAVDSVVDGAIGRVLESGDFDGESNRTLMLHQLPNIPAERVLLVGLGKKEQYTPWRYQSIISSAFEALERTGTRDAAVFLADPDMADRDFLWRVRQVVEGARYVRYRSDWLQTEKKKKPPVLNQVLIHLPEDQDANFIEQKIREGVAIANGVDLARDLGDLPGNICTPTYLAEQARAMAEDKKSVTVEILEEKEMAELGMGALLAVARGSREDAKLILLQYKGGKEGDKPIVLVGKGVTFDAGGISLKPGAKMDEMKFDMCGAASVLGALHAAMELALPLDIVGIIPATENLPDGNAVKPGDIVTTLSGQTVEILNTDAEGRLILCDALSYAQRFGPDVVIDIATLTGACRIALGAHASGLFSNHEPLADDLLVAGNESGDRAWAMPLWDEYQEQLKSNFADMANIGGPLAGVVTAACFLSRFIGDYQWAHLDIAGVSAREGKKKGATGRPVALLTQYLLNRSAAKDAE